MTDTRAEAIAEANRFIDVTEDSKEALKKEEEALKANADAVSALSTLMAGAVGNEMRAYGDKTVELKDKQAELLAQIEKYEKQQGKTVTVTEAATASEIELQLAAISLSEAQTKLSETSAENTKEYLQAQLAVQNAEERLVSMQGAMGTSTTVTLDYSTKLGELRGQLSEVNIALGENAKSHEDQTQRILFGILQQQLAVDGFTTDELLALNTVAEKWGLVDSQTAEATEGIIASVAKAHETGNWEALYGDLDGIDRRLRGLPTRVDIEVHTNYTSSEQRMAAIAETPPPISGGAQRYQHGGSFIIPPGYNENFPIGPRGGASSGERVTVSPAGGGGAEYQMMLLQMEGRMTRAFRDALMLARG